MNATLYLVRHAAHTLGNGVLLGRMANVALAKKGRGQASRLADRLAQEPITVVQSSPRERARQTAEPIASRLGVPVEVAPAVDEIEVGAWTGRSFDELQNDPDWISWNTARGNARPPQGESMAELQERVLSHLNAVASANPSTGVAIVTHAEVIRAALLHYLGMSLDRFAEVDVDIATVSTVAMRNGNGKVVAVNEAIGP